MILKVYVRIFHFAFYRYTLWKSVNQHLISDCFSDAKACDSWATAIGEIWQQQIIVQVAPSTRPLLGHYWTAFVRSLVLEEIPILAVEPAIRRNINHGLVYNHHLKLILLRFFSPNSLKVFWEGALRLLRFIHLRWIPRWLVKSHPFPDLYS